MSATTKMLKPSLGGYEETYCLDGYVSVAADASVISDDILGLTSARTGTGEYTLTFASDSKPSAVRSVQIHPISVANVDRVILLKSISTSAIVFRTMVGATPTDCNSICGFSVSITCRKTGVNR